MSLHHLAINQLYMIYSFDTRTEGHNGIYEGNQSGGSPYIFNGLTRVGRNDTRTSISIANNLIDA
jgi:hypothetical protein